MHKPDVHNVTDSYYSFITTFISEHYETPGDKNDVTLQFQKHSNRITLENIVKPKKKSDRHNFAKI